MSSRSMFFDLFIRFSLLSLLYSALSIEPTFGAAFISGSTIKCFNEGEDVKIPFLYGDPCIRCKCRNQEIACERDTCARKCSHNGRTYKSGDTWHNGTCTLCICSDGDIKCKAEVCPERLVCSNNERMVRLPGDCCPSCQEKDGECRLILPSTLSRGMTVKTFDGHTFPFNGLCNYVLARDVEEYRKFSIHVIHDFNGTSRTISSTLDSMAIVVKLEQVKVRLIRVSGPEMWTLRVGRQEAPLPFIKLGILSVIKNSTSIQVRSSKLGFKVVWTKEGEVFVSMPSQSKSKVVGLCGNYDGDNSNDLTSKKGRLLHSIDRFINSWKVGKKSGICSSERRRNPVSRTNFKTSSSRTGGVEGHVVNKMNGCDSDWEKKLKAIKVCNILKSTSFSSCHRRVSLAPYFRSCIEEVCSCSSFQQDKDNNSTSSNNNNCHCNALDSYVIQCQTSGIKLHPDWESLSSCDTRRSSSSSDATSAPAPAACPKGAIYTSCVNPCPRTCNNITGLRGSRGSGEESTKCNKYKCEAGCDCPPGLVWNINRCVHPRNCKVSSSHTTTSI